MTRPALLPVSGLAPQPGGQVWHTLSAEKALRAQDVDGQRGLSSTSAINSDKTGTLALNQMTAVAMAVVVRRYAVEGRGYSTEGQITRVAGQTEIPLDQFLMPMVLGVGCGPDRRRNDRRPDRGCAGRAGRQRRRGRRLDEAGVPADRRVPL